MTSERFLVTGAGGCIGAWVLKELQAEGATCFALDVSTDAVRPGLLMSRDQLEEILFIKADVTDGAQLLRLVEEHSITHIIHLAGLQVPFCKADPPQGARVNVVGTVNVFEAARLSRQTVRGIAYASSVAVLGPASIYPEGPVSDDASLNPRTLYGVYKQANEATARIYWDDFGIGSVGLRPYIVYGAARDQGLTSDLARAILAATVGRPFYIKFGGKAALQYTRDVAQMFIRAARAEFSGAVACNMQNDSVSIESFLETLRQVLPECEVDFDASVELPFPHRMDDSRLRSIIGEIPHTPLPEAILETSQIFRTLAKEGRIDLSQLE